MLRKIFIKIKVDTKKIKVDEGESSWTENS